MNDRLKWRMWSTHAGRYFDENNDAMLQNVFECMKQQICYDCQNPVLRKIYDRIAYNHIEDGMVFEQCTGLKDRNGKLIYEGDIVREISKKEPEYEEYITAVEWNNCGFNLYREDEYDFLIIGNIHENADLLEVEND